VTRIAVIHQIRILEEAQLLVSRKEGRKRRLYFNAVPIQMIHDRWTTELRGFCASRMADVKYSVESGSTKQTKASGRRRSKHGRAPEDGVAGRHQGKDRGRVA
jgi:predicted transcriptional regulator